MNEQIRKLAQQCYETGPIGRDGWPEYSRLNEQRFAELIVRECAEAVKNSVWHLPRGYKAADQAEFVKKHFGVE